MHDHMDFKHHFERAWHTFTAHLPAILALTLGLIAVSIITLGIMAPVMMAGYMQSLLLALRENRKPVMRDLFMVMRLFLPLFIFTLAVTLVLILGLAMLVLPGLVLMVVLSFFCIYMLPLMTDQGLGLIEAVKESARQALQPPIGEHLAVVVIFLVLNSLGNSTILGTLLTQPFATLFLLSVYESKRSRMLPPGVQRSPIAS